MDMDTASSPCQIVLAEDNPADVRLVRQALRDHAVHCDLRVIPDGEAVVTFIDGLDLDGKLPCPDLLLLDMHLPKRDGNEILRHLRASERCGHTELDLDPAARVRHDVVVGDDHTVGRDHEPGSLAATGVVVVAGEEARVDRSTGLDRD